MPSSPIPRLERLLHLLEVLQSAGRLTAQELAAEVGVSSRTVLRDLDALGKADIVVIRTEDGRYRLEGSAGGPWGLTEDEAVALLLVCTELGSRNTGLPGYESLLGVAEKLREAMPAAFRRRADARLAVLHWKQVERATPDRAAAFYEMLVEAAITRQRVRIRYRSLAEDSFIETDLAPYRLLFARRTWYCIAQSSLHGQVRTFHLGRIGTLEMLDKKFRIPKSWSLEDYFGDAWRLIRGEPTAEVEIRFSRQVARNVAEIVWHPTQSLTWNDDDSVTLTVSVDGLHEISWWILGYGAQAEVIRPDELRTIIREHAEAMRRIYGG